MLQLFYKQKGAVTVFLTLILVPVIVVCSCFIDLSRVRLAQGMINSAGDLALNTAMTSFDKTLNEIYGLLASCQSKDEVVDSVDEYFIKSLSSQGMEETQLQEFIKSLNNLLGKAETSDNVSDFLDITMNDGSFALDEVTNGNLTNPAVIKEQIVNFMKYRSVIDGTQKIMEKFDQIANGTKNMKENTEMVEAQQEASEKEETALQELKSLYDKIKEYQNEGITKSFLRGIKDQIDEIKNKYKKAHEFTVKNLLNYDDTYMADFPYKVEKNPAINVRERPSTSEYKTAILDYNQALNDYMDCAYLGTVNLYDTIQSFPEKSRTDGWQYYVQTYRILKETKIDGKEILEKYIIVTNKLIKAYKILTKIKSNMENNGGPHADDSHEIAMQAEEVYSYPSGGGNAPYDGWSKNSSVITKTYDEWYHYFMDDDIYSNKLKKDFINNSGLFEKLRKFMKNYIDNNREEHTNISDYNADIQGIYDYLNGGSGSVLDRLKKGIEKLDAMGTLIQEAKSAVEAYETSMSDWKHKIESSSSPGSEFTKGQEEAFESIKEDEKDIYKKITVERIDFFESRVNELKGNLQAVVNAINNIGYGGKKVKNIQDFHAFRDACSIIVDSDAIPLNRTELENLWKTTFQSGYTEVSLDISWADSKDPDLAKSAEPDKPPIYQDLEEQFKEDVTEEDKENNKKYEEYKKKGEDSSEDNSKPETSYPTCVDTQIKDKTELPSQGRGALVEKTKKSTEIGEAGEEAGSFFEKLQDCITHIARDFRDDLFITDYIMSMFTYDTYTNEHLYEIAKNKGKDVKTYEKTKEMLKNANTEDKIKEVWESEDKTVTENKTITNQLLNTENNYSYGNEVEYILYGGENGINKLKSWGIIFASQFSMNTIYGFTQFWTVKANGDFAETAGIINIMADSIYAATLGLVPPAVSKVVMILALAAMETAHDILCMRAGMPMALLKDKHTWACSLEGMMDSYDPDASDKLKMNYSTYLTLFLFIAQLNAESAKNIYLRTADVIQANMQYRLKRDSGDNSYLLKNSRTYYKLKAKFTVHPLMLKLPIVINSGLAEENPKDNSEWYTISYEAIRGYY